MKRTGSKAKKNHSPTGPPVGKITRRRGAISWKTGTNGPEITAAFSSDDPDTFHLLADLFTPLMLRRAHGDGADDILKMHGFKYNPQTRRATRIRDGEGKDLLSECVWRLYSMRYRAEYRKASPAKKSEIRQKIGTALAPWFDEAELSPKTGCPIYSAIWNGEYRNL